MDNPLLITERCKPPEEEISSYQLHLKIKLAEIRGLVEGHLVEAQKCQKYYDRHVDSDLINTRFVVRDGV